MTPKYTIISINDERADFKKAIRERVLYQEHSVPAVNGNAVDLHEEIENRGLLLQPIWANAKKGEVGVWLSNYDCWATAAEIDEPLIVFEDDAIPSPIFNYIVDDMVTHLPDDWDVFTLWVPENQLIDYQYEVEYDIHGHPLIAGTGWHGDKSYYYIGSDRVSKTYQGYGMVANMYSPNGGRKLVDLAHNRGIDNPVDCWLFEEIHKGNLNGYAPRPGYTSIVAYDWNAPSHVQITERLI